MVPRMPAHKGKKEGFWLLPFLPPDTTLPIPDSFASGHHVDSSAAPAGSHLRQHQKDGLLQPAGKLTGRTISPNAKRSCSQKIPGAGQATMEVYPGQMSNAKANLSSARISRKNYEEG